MSSSDPVTASLPRTEAGKALLPWLAGHFFSDNRLPSEAWDKALHDIHAIEEQAATEARRELLAALESLVNWYDMGADEIDEYTAFAHARTVVAQNRRLIEASE
jgi:hypothetical protein